MVGRRQCHARYTDTSWFSCIIQTFIHIGKATLGKPQGHSDSPAGFLQESGLFFDLDGAPHPMLALFVIWLGWVAETLVF
jgi:hypothetical protein